MRGNTRSILYCLIIVGCFFQVSTAMSEDLRPSNFQEQLLKFKNTIEYKEGDPYFSSGELIVAINSESEMEKVGELLSISWVIDVISKKIDINRSQDKIEIFIVSNLKEKLSNNYFKDVVYIDPNMDYVNISCHSVISNRKDGVFDGEKTGFVFIDSNSSIHRMNFCLSSSAMFFLGVRKTSFEYFEIKSFNPVNTVLLRALDTIVAYTASRCRNQKSKDEFDSCVSDIVRD